MIYIVGGRGFVGSAYVRYCANNGLACQVIDRDNFRDFSGTECDLLINANGNSSKMLASRDPVLEFDLSVRSVAESLAAFRARRYVFLSSGDVYPDPSRPEGTDEAEAIDIARTSRYGLHKYLAEQLVAGTHPDWLIVRMGGFVGRGIRKNAIFDILNGGKVWLSADSRLQFINTDSAAQLVMDLVARGISKEVVNLGGRGLVRIGDIHSRVGSNSFFDADSPVVRYELSLSKLQRLCGVAPPVSEEEVLSFTAGWPQSGAAA